MKNSKKKLLAVAAIFSGFAVALVYLAELGSSNIGLFHAETVQNSIVFSKNTGSPISIGNKKYVSFSRSSSGTEAYLLSQGSAPSYGVASLESSSDYVTVASDAKGQSLFRFQYVRDISVQLTTAVNTEFSVVGSLDGSIWENLGELSLLGGSGRFVFPSTVHYFRLTGVGEISSLFISYSCTTSVNSDGLPEIFEDGTWNIGGALNSLRGEEFRNSLASSILKTGSKTCSYSALWDYFVTSDASTSGEIRPFYHEPTYSVPKSSCNKEHTWPSSRGAGETGPGSDPQIIRPAVTSENSRRGNNYFGTPTSSSVFDPADCGYEGARGEAARICFYAATRYYDTCGTSGSSKGSEPLSLNNNPSSSTLDHTMGTLKTLLEWNRKYPVNAAEIKRNEVLDDLGFARNPFIDHPEYADYIWDDNGLRDSKVSDQPPSSSSSSDSSSQETESSSEESSAANVYQRVNDASEIEAGKSYFVVAKNGSSSYAMTLNPTSPSKPWYIKGQSVSMNSDGTIDRSASGFATWTIEGSKGSYTFANPSGDLYSYVEGTHYSISIGEPTQSGISSVSSSWDISFDANGVMTAVGLGTNVHLEYYSSRFCGYKADGSIPLYLYKI